VACSLAGSSSAAVAFYTEKNIKNIYPNWLTITFYISLIWGLSENIFKYFFARFCSANDIIFGIFQTNKGCLSSENTNKDTLK